jgi:hypothetical protein
MVAGEPNAGMVPASACASGASAPWICAINIEEL